MDKVDQVIKFGGAEPHGLTTFGVGVAHTSSFKALGAGFGAGLEAAGG